MKREVRVRFAPSPTGPLHIGGVRTALFNYLFAKKNNGTFFLRIEDTDQNRFVEGAEQYIFETLEWLGIQPDETIGKNEKFGPYKQSERKHIYKKYADLLINYDKAYYAFDSVEELDNLRKEAESKGETFIYNWSNRTTLNNSLRLSKEEVDEKIANNEPYVIRFKTPTNEILELKDIIRGDLKFDTNLLDDKVLYKSDGMPTYHLANVVDDNLMQTSHVIRGEEWLPSMPLHVMLYRAFGWEAPEFAHLPLILKPVGNGKLSKRDGDKYGFPVFPLEWKSEDKISSGYRENGFYPEAVINFLAMLGWNDGTEQEYFSLSELCEKFDLSRVNKSGAKFDYVKNKMFNHHYLQQKDLIELTNNFYEFLEQKNIKRNKNEVSFIVNLIKERANFENEFWDLSKYMFEKPTQYDDKDFKLIDDESKIILVNFNKFINEFDIYDSETMENEIKTYIKNNQINMGKAMKSLRIALVGKLEGIDLFTLMKLLGKDETIERINNLINKIN